MKSLLHPRWSTFEVSQPIYRWHPFPFDSNHRLDLRPCLSPSPCYFFRQRTNASTPVWTRTSWSHQNHRLSTSRRWPELNLRHRVCQILSYQQQNPIWKTAHVSVRFSFPLFSSPWKIKTEQMSIRFVSDWVSNNGSSNCSITRSTDSSGGKDIVRAKFEIVDRSGDF